MQAFILTDLSNNELDKFVLKMLLLKRTLFQHMNKVLQEIDEAYPFVMSNCLLIIISVLASTVIIIILRMICYFKYCKATDMVRHFLT